MNRPASDAFAPPPARPSRRLSCPARGRRAALVACALLMTAGSVSPLVLSATKPGAEEAAQAADSDAERATPETAAATPVQSATRIIRAGDIAPFDVVYDVGNNLITAGIAELSFRRDGDEWVYSLATKPTGVFKLTGKGRIRETSIIDVVGSGDTVQLQPRSYAYRQDDEKRRSIDAAFDWSARQLSWARRDEAATESFDDPVLDRLSVTLAVMHALRQGFEEIEFAVFDSDEIKTMRFVNEGTETLKTAMGKVETIRVRGENVAGSSRSTRTWFAPSLDYIPVRIEQRKRDELVARMSLKRLRNRVTDIELAPPEKGGSAGESVPAKR